VTSLLTDVQGIEDGEDGTAQQVVVELASVAELMRKRGCGLQVRRLDLGHQLAVFWHRDRPYVLNDSCPHRGGASPSTAHL
jgi:nitrite reductase/ring-hydroxylating ferredoxin subunit